MPHYAPPKLKANSLEEMRKMPLAHLQSMYELTTNQLNVAVRLTKDAKAATVLRHRKLMIKWCIDNHSNRL